MKHQNWPVSTHLAILQQCEYDLALYNDWLTSQHVLDAATLSALQPETHSSKLKLIEFNAKILSNILPRHRAITFATQKLLPLEFVARHLLLWRAEQHLRRLQKNGLVVIGIAGSYGKTSIKHQLKHFLSLEHMTAMSPASYNTPLGLASSILSLTRDHDVFIAEIGEYQPGDVDTLLRFLKPDIGILGPVGYAHGERFGSEEALVKTFTELWQSSDAPDMILIDDVNRRLFEHVPQNVFWYGEDAKSDLRLDDVKVSLQGGTGRLVFSDGTKLNFHTNLIHTTQLRNTLPAFILQQSFRRPVQTLIQALDFVPNTPRRLELHANPNGTFVIDNSYNTNPGSWNTVVPLITSLCKSGLVLLTPGFVELSEEQNAEAHKEMARDIIAMKATVGVIRSRFNTALIEELERSLSKEQLFIGDSYDDLLNQLSTRSIHLTYLWLEGGLREMYQ